MADNETAETWPEGNPKESLLIKDLDGKVPKWFVDALYDIDKADPTTADGTLDRDEFLQEIKGAADLKKATAQNSDELQYSHFPPKVRKVLEVWDADGSGTVSAGELSAAADAQHKLENMNVYLQRLLVLLLVVVLTLIITQFAMGYASAELAKDSKPSGSGIAKVVGSTQPLAMAGASTSVKLSAIHDEAKYTVKMLKNMKTMSFTTPSGSHVYDVVGVNRRTVANEATTSVFTPTGHVVKVTKKSANLIYPKGENEPVTGRRLSDGRKAENIFMRRNKYGRRLQQSEEPECELGMVAEEQGYYYYNWAPPTSDADCDAEEAGSKLCGEEGNGWCSWPGQDCPPPPVICDDAFEVQCWDEPPSACWEEEVPPEGVDCYGKEFCAPHGEGCPVKCSEEEVACSESWCEDCPPSNFCMPKDEGCPAAPAPAAKCEESTEVRCWQEPAPDCDDCQGHEFCASKATGCPVECAEDEVVCSEKTDPLCHDCAPYNYCTSSDHGCPPAPAHCDPTGEGLEVHCYTNPPDECYMSETPPEGVDCWTHESCAPAATGCPVKCDKEHEVKCNVQETEEESGYAFCEMKEVGCPPAPVFCAKHEVECYEDPPEACWESWPPPEGLNCWGHQTCAPRATGCPVHCDEATEKMCTRREGGEGYSFCVSNDEEGCPSPPRGCEEWEILCPGPGGKQQCVVDEGYGCPTGDGDGEGDFAPEDP